MNGNRTINHTPEPWTKYANSPDDDKLPSIMATHPVTGRGLFYVAQCNTDPDANRIVAAVNGCQGLNPAAYREMVKAAKVMVEKQRSFAVVTAQDVSRLEQAIAHAEERT